MMPCLENIIDIFEEMKRNGWDVKRPLKWGFFFFSHSRDKLDKIYTELKDYSYKVESIHKTDDGEQWVLQVSKVEILEAEKLHRRNISFNDLAEFYDSLYDGWDVGKK